LTETATAVRADDELPTISTKKKRQPTEREPASGGIRLPLPSAPPKVRVVERDAESTHLIPMTEDASEFERTIPAHGVFHAPVDDEHDLERTIPVTSMVTADVAALRGMRTRAAQPNENDATAGSETPLPNMADWANTQRIRRVKSADLPDATRRIEVPAAMDAGRDAGRAGPASEHAPSSQAASSQPVPSQQVQAALAEVLSGLPADERRWLIGAAMVGMALAVGLALWLLL
jgi:hypothetical protein